MKIIPIKAKSLVAVEKELKTEVLIEQQSNGLWSCKFSDFVEKKEGIMLGSSGGDIATTIDAAIQSFCQKISHTTLVKNAISKTKRLEVKTPEILFVSKMD